MAESFPWEIQQLDRFHERDAFECGVPSLDVWLKRLAGQYERRDLARTFVAVRKGQRNVLGYYAISSHRVAFDALPADQAKGLPVIDVPVILLGRLAVDRSVQGQGLGACLLLNAMQRVSHLSRQLGILAVEVHAIDDKAREFYRKHGFTCLRDDQHHLFLPMHAIRRLDLPRL